MSDLIKEIEKEKHSELFLTPDAGKTTLTEKLLLFGGAIQEAGAVKSNKIKKGATLRLYGNRKTERDLGCNFCIGI